MAYNPKSPASNLAHPSAKRPTSAPKRTMSHHVGIQLGPTPKASVLGDQIRHVHQQQQQQQQQTTKAAPPKVPPRDAYGHEEKRSLSEQVESLGHTYATAPVSQPGNTVVMDTDSLFGETHEEEEEVGEIRNHDESSEDVGGSSNEEVEDHRTISDLVGSDEGDDDMFQKSDSDEPSQQQPPPPPPNSRPKYGGKSPRQQPPKRAVNTGEASADSKTVLGFKIWYDGKQVKARKAKDFDGNDLDFFVTGTAFDLSDEDRGVRYALASLRNHWITGRYDDETGEVSELTDADLEFIRSQDWIIADEVDEKPTRTKKRTPKKQSAAPKPKTSENKKRVASASVASRTDTPSAKRRRAERDEDSEDPDADLVRYYMRKLNGVSPSRKAALCEGVVPRMESPDYGPCDVVRFCRVVKEILGDRFDEVMGLAAADSLADDGPAETTAKAAAAFLVHNNFAKSDEEFSKDEFWR